MRTNTRAVVLAAGLGTRLRPLTDKTPKCLIPINDRPLLDYWLESLKQAGVRDVLINTHHLREKVVEYIHRVNSQGHFAIHESYERILLGSAGTIRANRAWMNDADDCLIVYADNLSSVDLSTLLQFHRTHGDPLTMMLFRTHFPKQCGIAELDEQERIVSFVEKPDRPTSNLANAGVYVVSAQAYAEIAGMNKFDLAFEVLPEFLGRMRGWAFQGYHRDIGNLESLRQAELEVRDVYVRQWETMK